MRTAARMESTNGTKSHWRDFATHGDVAREGKDAQPEKHDGQTCLQIVAVAVVRVFELHLQPVRNVGSTEEHW